MNTGRIVLVVTCAVVGALCAYFAIASWDTANRVATVTSAAAAVAAVGVAVWMAVRADASSDTSATVRVSDTGDAKADAGGSANTGIRGGGKAKSLRVKRTGKATATGGGDANTGVEL